MGRGWEIAGLGHPDENNAFANEHSRPSQRLVIFLALSVYKGCIERAQERASCFFASQAESAIASRLISFSTARQLSSSSWTVRAFLHKKCWQVGTMLAAELSVIW